MKEENAKPLIVLKYHKGKMLGRFVCFWGPIMSLCALMMHTAIQQSKWTMFISFLFFFAGSVFYWILLLIAKEFVLYKDRIVNSRRIKPNISIMLNEAILSVFGVWNTEMMTISNHNYKLEKGRCVEANVQILILQGFIKRSELSKFFEVLSHLTDKTTEELSKAKNINIKTIERDGASG